MQSLKLVEWKNTTLVIKRQATDLVNVPIVTDGYALSGKPRHLVFTNLHAMAISRFRKHFPFADISDPYMDRIFAEIKKICASCIVKKYEAQKDRIKYNHLAEATRLVNDWMKSFDCKQLQLKYDDIQDGNI